MLSYPSVQSTKRVRNAMLALQLAIALASGSASAVDPCVLKFLPADEERLANLMSGLGLATAGVTLGEYRALYHQGIGVATSADPAARDLAEVILSSGHRPVSEVVDALNEWMRLHTTWKRLAFPDSIRALGDRGIREGKLSRPPGGWIQPNGLVDSPLYAALVREGSFPVADPHDLLAHLLSLADPDFDRAFREQMELTYRASSAIGFIPIQSLDGVRGGPRFTARVEAFRQIQGFVRNGTQENWTFILKDGSGTGHFHGQGNMPFNGYRALRNGHGDVFVQRVLNGDFRSSLTALKRLPGIAAFREDPAHALISARFEAALRRQGANADEYARIEFRLRSLIPQDWRIGRRTTEIEADAFLDRFVTLVENDVFLSDLFSRRSRLELYEASNAFYRAYLNFASDLPES